MDAHKAATVKTEWPLVKLGEVCGGQSGGTPFRREKGFYGGSIPWAKISDIEASDGVVTQTEETITTEGLQKIGNCLFPVGSVLLAMYASVGKVALAGIELATNQAILAINTKDANRLDNRYLFYWLENERENIAHFAHGSTQMNLSARIVKALAIPLPPLDVQLVIAAILDKADTIRRKRQQALTLADNFLRATFLDMFGDPVTNPKGWELCPLGDVAELINGDRSSNYPSGDDIKSEGVPFISTKNILDGTLDLSNLNFISQEKFGSLGRGKLQQHDLIITLRGSLGLCAEFDCEYETGFINAQMMIIRTKPQLNCSYFLHLTRLPSIRALFQRMGSGSAVPQLTAKQFANWEMPIPPTELQSKFLDIADAQRQSVQRLRRLSQTTSELFASLSQRAFRGEL